MIDFHERLSTASEAELTRKMEGMHPADLGRLLRAVAKAYDKRTGMQHPDFKSGIDACESVYQSKAKPIGTSE